MPIWTRDPDDLSLRGQSSEALGFQAFLANMPTLLDFHFQPLDLDLWISAVQRLRPGSARGTDKISAQELKLLPPEAIEALAKICHSFHDGFPESFMRGLICPLSKIDSCHPASHQVRPIIVLPQIYRLWSAVMCAQLIRALALVLPEDISGLLP